MPNCCAYKCQSKSREKEPGISFHSFPRDPDRCKIWVDNMKLKSFSPNKSHRLCSKHFEEHWFYKTDLELRVRLLNEAIPTIFPQLPKYLQPRKIKKRRPIRQNVDTQEQRPVTSLISDPDMLRKKKLKKKIIKEVRRSQFKSNKIQILRQSVRRYRKTVASLKENLRNLRKSSPKVEADEEGEVTINLPIGYEYTNFSDIIENNMHFYCNELKTDADIQHWVKEFGEQNYVEWRIARTHPNVQGVKCSYRIDYRCQHSSTWYNSRSSKVRQSSVKCPSKLIIKRTQQSKYDFDGFSTVIHLRNQHNHATGATETSLKYRDVSEKTKEMLIKLFANGHSPSSAHKALLSEAMVEFGGNSDSVVADRNEVPDINLCYNLFYKVLKNDYGSLEEVGKGECSEHHEIDEIPSISDIEENHKENCESIDINGDLLQMQEDQEQKCHINRVTESLRNVFDDIIRRVQSGQSRELLRASESFCKSYRVLCKGDNSLRSAMWKFGRNNRRSRVVIPSTIGVQPSSAARNISLQRNRVNLWRSGRGKEGNSA